MNNKELQGRLHELSILYELSKAMSYTLDYKQLLRLIMDSLYKVMDYHVCASLLLSKEGGELNIRVAYPVSDDFIQDVKSKLIDAITSVTERTIKEEKLSIVVERQKEAEDEERRSKGGVSSFFNVPLVSKRKVIGIINISSLKENAFSESDISLLYTLANQASTAIERLRTVIAAEKSKMEAMVESMLEGVIMTDERRELVVINPAAKKLLGFKPDEQVTSKQLEKLFAKGIGFAEEEVMTEIRVEEPEPRVLYAAQAPVKGLEGKRLGIVTVLRDITKEKETDRMKTDFVSTVSHELRTPLAITKEGINLVLDGITGKINKKQDKILTTARDNIDRLARIINNLLDISKIEARKVELKKNLVDIDALVDKIISSLKPQADKKNIELKVTSPPDLGDFYVDPDKITQVFTNLINNAVKFTQEGGRVSVTIKNKDKEVECSVSDTGIGVPRNELSKIFDKFHQVDRVSGTGEKGTGLGLAITKELIGMHKGRIWIESKLGKGSKFTFTLPKIDTETIFREYLNNGMIQAKEEGITLSLMVIGLANFERMKEKYKAKGIIKILTQIGEIITKTVFSPVDIVNAHHKGETVLVLLKAGQKDAIALEKKFKKAIKAHQFMIKGKTVKVEVNFGIATYPEEAQTEDELIKKSKASLEGRKKKGGITMAKTRVLLVDDEKDFLDIMKQRMEFWGYEVMPVSGGREAIDAVKNRKTNIVVLDYMMPKMDGLSTLKEIRKINLHIPVIMFTAHPDERAISGTERLGVFAFIPKFNVGPDAESNLKTALKMAEKKFLTYRIKSVFERTSHE